MFEKAAASAISYKFFSFRGHLEGGPSGVIQNYYEVLSLNYDSSMEDVSEAYRMKILNCKNEIMKEQYQTAYYHLSNSKRRHKYDVSLGIHKYKKVGLLRKSIKMICRTILTLLDAIMTLWWYFLIVIILYAVIRMYYVLGKLGNIDISWIWKNYPDEVVILFLCSLLDILLHFYVRRANRYIKHMKWEVEDEYEVKEVSKNDRRPD